ncbi:MAG: U32 family peptidase, partial [Candidatus Thiodiazotropha sp. (ex Semelilucina semeliformis)]|nr:U32 family peptidase [Candidatus Thiodiazotropha sp. (ex Semelilucina semeliformis)]
IKAIKIEGRQRSPAYVGMVAKVWREAIDSILADPDGFTPKVEWNQALNQVSEGATTTLGPYYRPWQ